VIVLRAPATGIGEDPERTYGNSLPPRTATASTQKLDATIVLGVPTPTVPAPHSVDGAADGRGRADRADDRLRLRCRAEAHERVIEETELRRGAPAWLLPIALVRIPGSIGASAAAAFGRNPGSSTPVIVQSVLASAAEAIAAGCALSRGDR